MIALFARAGLLVLTLGGAAAAAAPPGFRMSAPTVFSSDAGVRVHGQVCRVSALPPAGLAAVRVERLDGSGRVTGVVMARVSRALTGRESGCGVYDGRADWRLSASDRVEVCAGRGCRAG